MYKLKRCRYGTMLFNEHDHYIGRSLDQYGEWSEPEPFLFSQIVRPGDVVIEAGANIGAHTLALSEFVGDDGRVHAFEPQQHVFQLLCANVALNERLNVRTHQIAIGDRDGVAQFPIIDPRQPNNFGGASFYEAATFPTEPTPIRTLDSFGFERVDFIKADVEGYETNLLDGAMATIGRTRPILYLEYLTHHTQDSSRALMDRLSGLGYQFWYYICPAYNQTNYLNNKTNIFEGVWSFDLLCVPADRGTVSGAIDASTGISHCDDPEAWRAVRFERAS